MNETGLKSPLQCSLSQQGAEKTFVEEFLSDLREVQPVTATSPMNRPQRSYPAETKSTKPRQDARDIREPELDSAGRLVINHSTHIPGLIAALERLAETKGIRTIVPGRLYTSSGNQARLSIRITVCTDSGFKMIARKGSQTQEVFVVTDLDRDTLDGAIAWSL